MIGDIFLGIMSFIISGIDDFIILFLLFYTAKNIKNNLEIILGTTVALLLVILFSIISADFISNVIGYFSFFIILISSYKIFGIIKDRNEEEKNEELNEINFLRSSFVIYLLNAMDDIIIYSSFITQKVFLLNTNYYFIGIFIGLFITFVIAFILIQKLKEIEAINKLDFNLFIKIIPYIVVIIIGILNLI